MSRAPLYFAYGSNLDAVQMRARCPTARPLRVARLADHRLDFTHYSTRWQGGAADILPAPGMAVWGLVYEMGPEDFARLDPFESGYRRIDLALDGTGELLTATSYTVVAKGQFAPHPVYLEKMLRWGARWRLPGDYLAALTTTRSPTLPR